MRRAKTTDARLQSASDAHVSWQHQHGGGSATYRPLSPGKRHVTMGTQTDTAVEYLPYIPNEKSTMTAMYEDAMMQAQRMGAMSMDEDPSCNNFYQRMKMSLQQLQQPYYQEPESKAEPAPTFRSGNMGGSWRHVTQCTGAMGNNICFVDGEVKKSDVQNYPPFGFENESANIQNRRKMLQSAPIRRPEPSMGPALQGYKPIYMKNNGVSASQMPNINSSQSAASANRVVYPRKRTSYNNHARKGFKYWYDEKPPGMASRPARTIMGQMMKCGVGY